MIGKFFARFPTIGKNFRAHFLETKRTKRTTNHPANKIVRQFRQFPTIVFGDNMDTPEQHFQGTGRTTPPGGR
jgi:hypothetical protein